MDKLQRNRELERVRATYEAARQVDNVNPQERGLQFEQMIKDALAAFGLEPRGSYRSLGEQVDGSFVHKGRPFLLEAKWTADPIPASTLYAFKGKVDGKLTGTIGVFVSISGYSEDAVDALVAGKSINLILFDKDDWEDSIAESVGFDQVLVQKLRFAAEEGSPLYPADQRRAREVLLLVITEGPIDKAIVMGALTRLSCDAASKTVVVSAWGASNVANVARDAVEKGLAKRIIAIFDNDVAGKLGAQGLLAPPLSQVEAVFSDPFLDRELLLAQIEQKYQTYENYRVRSYASREQFVKDAIKTVSLSSIQEDAVLSKILENLR